MKLPSRNAGSARLPKAVFLLVAFSFLIGCVGTAHQLVNVWKDPQNPTAPLKNILVVGMINDAATRRLWEDSFSNGLAKYGASATPSYRLFPAAVPDTQQVAGVVREREYDGVILNVRLPSQTKTTYVPGYVNSVPATGYDPWLNVFYTYYQTAYEPGYTEHQSVLRYRTDVWSTRGPGHLVWTGTSEVIDPSSTQQLDRYLTKMVVPELAKKGVIPSGKI